jgi:hypothetical protein
MEGRIGGTPELLVEPLVESVERGLLGWQRTEGESGPQNWQRDGDVAPPPSDLA